MSNPAPSLPKEPKETGTKGAEYVKALAWPVLAILLVFFFWTPARETAALLPELLRDSETIEVGKVKLGIKKSIAKRASEAVREALVDMKAPDVRLILQSESQTFLFCDAKESDENIQQFHRLEAKKLVSALTAEQLTAEKTTDPPPCAGERLTFGFATTILWDSVQKFLVEDLIPGLISDAQKDRVVEKSNKSKKAKSQ
jgi:hypothetical protein